MKQNFILNTPLPITQDFKSLKNEALAYVQEHGGNEWTNLNPSDPGVTIVDQLCYALTELGYCNDFSINDILTGSNGKLQIKNQFYLPENILTTSPVTFIDYRKYLIDSVSGLKNAIISAENNTFYQVYFATKDETIAIGSQIENETLYALNKCRNINELFLYPKKLLPFTQYLTGTIEVANENEIETILIGINTAIENYIFPLVKQLGYSALQKEGLNTNEIFNGPLLQHGWINSDSLGTKKDVISINEIYELITAIKGVTNVAQLDLVDLNEITYHKTTQLIKVDISKLNITCKRQSLNYDLNAILTKIKPAEIHVVLGASVDIQTDVPKGKYRDINSYYSIQNTFPEIYAVGASTITENATQFQIAQSRQLKGYLTLFDQVLANQFSQLANVDQLFSFKNSMNGNPSDVKEFYAVKDDYEKRHIIYPAPYLTFSPSYFYQSIYHIPYIRPLLKDNNEFRLMKKNETEKELEHESWKAYKQNPYNPYMHGLMEYMTDEKNDLTRRNTILDHLLARHGESALIIDAIIDGSTYTRNKLKDQVIFKSLYLQNLGLLSYYRHKAYNFLGANKLKKLDTLVPISYEQVFLEKDTIDTIFNAEVVDHNEKLTAGDFINYAAVELKLGLLFGLKVHYRNHLINCYQRTDEIARGNEIRLGTWMIEQRKGFIFVETNLLWENNNYEITLILNEKFWVIEQAISYRQLLAINQVFIQNKAINITTINTKHFFEVNGVNYPISAYETLPKGVSLENSFHSISIKDGIKLTSDQSELIFDNAVVLIFPLFLKSDTFINRLEIFLQETLPVTVTYNYYFIDNDLLTSFIHTFINWHNSMIFVDPDLRKGPIFNPNTQKEALRLSSIAMADKLVHFKLNNDE